jgi:hypothetical protein
VIILIFDHLHAYSAHFAHIAHFFDTQPVGCALASSASPQRRDENYFFYDSNCRIKALKHSPGLWRFALGQTLRIWGYVLSIDLF